MTKTKKNDGKLIIGFAGRKRCGKGLITTGLKEWFEQNTDRPVKIVTIASYLKKLSCKLIDIPTVEELNSLKDRGVELNIQIPVDEWVDKLHENSGIEKDILHKELTEKGTILDARELLQYIGTDVFRKYYPGWHIDQAIKDIEAAPDNAVILIDDVRFPNEKEGIEALGGDIYFIARPNCLAVSNHASETSLTWGMFTPSHILINNSTPEDILNVAIAYIAKSERTDSTQLASNREFTIPFFFEYDERQSGGCFYEAINEAVKERGDDCSNPTLFIKYPEEALGLMPHIGMLGGEKVDDGLLFTNPLIIESLKTLID